MTESKQQVSGNTLNVRFSEVAPDDYSSNGGDPKQKNNLLKPVQKDEELHIDTLRPTLNKRVSVILNKNIHLNYS